LCPNVNKSSWSLEEEMILLLIHNKIGNKWSEIANYLKGRTDNNIKNHWNSTMQKRLNFVDESLKNKKIEIRNRYREDNEENLEKIIIEEFMTIIETQMKKIIDDKHKNYENFKNMKIDYFSSTNNNASTFAKHKYKENEKEISDNNRSILKLRKILGFRTHSKKRKKTSKKNRPSSLVKKCQIKKEDINKNKIKINELMNNNQTNIIENSKYINVNNDISNDKENKFNCKTPNSNRIINLISPSIKETEDSSDMNRVISGDSIPSAFHSINREENLPDKRCILSHKYTPIKVITPYDDVNNNKGERNNNTNVILEFKQSKQNLNLLFNNIEKLN
jgi:hypothetical protein